MRSFYLGNVFVKSSVFRYAPVAGKSKVLLIESLSMALTANGRRQKLNFLASILNRLYTKVKIFAFTVNKRFFLFFY